MKIEIQAVADDRLADDEVAAAIAAVRAVLEVERQPPEPAASPGWSHAARLDAQGIRPVKLGVAPRWSTIDRLRRAVGGRYNAHGI